MQLLNGKKVAEHLYLETKKEISKLKLIPKIVFVLVGDDPASLTYVNAKAKRSEELGVSHETIRLERSTETEALVALIQKLNRDSLVHGILVQLPLPDSIDKQHVLNAIHPLKDVDGLTRINAGRLLKGESSLLPCTPAGIIELLRYYQFDLAGKTAAVLGRSEIVGKPLVQLLNQKDMTVTWCHSKTQRLDEITRSVDFVFVAIGRPKWLKTEGLSAHSVVVDVGIHRTPEGICGDVDFVNVSKKVKAITPVPGGVGPLTIAQLLKNLVIAAGWQQSGRTLT